MTDSMRNWAGNLTYSASRLHVPESIDQVRNIVARSNKLRVLGTRHSFNTIADSQELISLTRLNRIVDIDPHRLTVTVQGGTRYGDLCPQLHDAGYALANLASLPHISVAGACATATHGSGDRNGNLATAVSAMEMVTAEGEVVHLSREGDAVHFQGAVVGLGGLGVVTQLTLDMVPAFAVRQVVYENLPMAKLQECFDDVVSSAYSVSLFTDWQTDTINRVWFKHLAADGDVFELKPDQFGATLASGHRHPASGHKADHCTEQMGLSGPWHQRLPHFRLDSLPSTGDELQSEYYVPRSHASAALRAIDEIRTQIAPILRISEVRTIARDSLWMSPCYRQSCVAFHFTWKNDWHNVRRVLPTIEAQLEPFAARPHWGKLFTMAPSRLQSRYEKLPEFQQLLSNYDPQGKFRNAFLDTYIFGG